VTAAPVQGVPGAGVNGAASGSTTPAPRRVSLARARMRLLDASYAGLASRSGGQRVLDGIVSIGAGGVIFATSWLIPRTMSAGVTTDLHPWLWATSGYLALQGIVNLAWAPARERLSRQYSEMPTQTAAQRRERMRLGERALDEMAADGHRRRILGGIANIAATTGLVLIPYAPAIFNGTPQQLGLTDAVVMAYGGVSVLFSVIQMFSQSEEERLRNAYYQQVELIRAERARNP
jgi:hypothetical protein